MGVTEGVAEAGDMNATVAVFTGCTSDTYSRGRPAHRETVAGVAEMQRVGVRIGRYERRRLERLATAEAISYELERANVPSPLPPIDYDVARLEAERERCRKALQRQLGREPYIHELAPKVVETYRRKRGDPAVEATLRKLGRLVRELRDYEYAHLGVDLDDFYDEEGKLILRVRTRKSVKRPLPPPR